MIVTIASVIVVGVLLGLASAFAFKCIKDSKSIF